MSDTHLDDVMRLTQFCKRYPDLLTEKQLRWALFKREFNGLQDSGAVVKRGGKWFVVVPNIRAWVLGLADA